MDKLVLLLTYFLSDVSMRNVLLFEKVTWKIMPDSPKLYMKRPLPSPCKSYCYMYMYV